MWLPQPVQVALPQVGQVAGEHIGVTFLVGSDETVAYPQGYGNSSQERPTLPCPPFWGLRQCDILHTSFRVTIRVPTTLMVQRNGRSRETMWDRARKSAREAREFASLHALVFHADVAPELPVSKSAHPFQQEQRRQCVSGEWRGRAVQRFSTSAITVELMTLPGILPRLQVIPSGLEREALAVGGRAVPTGDSTFDSRWTVMADDAEFAAAFLSSRVREALLHPAASGRALVVDGSALYLWAPGEQPWSETRVRFEFLSVISGRIEADVWGRFDATPQARVEGEAPSMWVPGDEPLQEEALWRVATLPLDDTGDEPGMLGDTGEFEVALLNAELDGVTFLPGPDDTAKAYESWRVAPVVRA